MRPYGYSLCLGILISLASHVISDTQVLYNTKAASSDLDWTLQPTYNGWEELSNLDVDGNTIRSYQVCNIEESNQDNWARSPFIDAKSAKRIYVDIEFSVMKCPDCRETFTLYYYPSSSNVASSTFPPWHEQPFVKIDTVAAGERFESSNASPGGINKKTLVIGSLKRRGFYIAAQDQGACMSLMSVKLYYHYCPDITHNLAYFPETVTGGDAASLVSVDGKCVSNAMYIDAKVPKYRCNSNGEWRVPTGLCQCRDGYSPSNNRTSCQACPLGFYKSSAGNFPCRPCPSYSKSHTTASSKCVCNTGFYRASTDSIHQPCTRPPSQPSHLTYNISETSIWLSWSPPSVTGNRVDLYYSITCKECNRDFESCDPCSDLIKFEPSQRDHVIGYSMRVTDLKPSSYYAMKVASHNGVSTMSNRQEAFEIIQFSTNEAVPSKVLNLSILKEERNSVTFQWMPPLRMNGKILEYEIQAEGIAADGTSTALIPFVTESSLRNHTIDGLKSDTLYEIRVRARTVAGFGPFSATLSYSTPADYLVSPQPKQGESVGMIAGIAAGVAGLLLVLVVLLLLRCRRANVQRATEVRARSKLATCENAVELPKQDGFGSARHGTQKTYVDYRDPHKGVKEIAREIDVGRIKIERVIGRGEFGEVCKGKLIEGKSSTTVAVKRLQHGASLIDQTNFLREACTIAQFCHSNIVQFKGVVTKSIPAMIITEFMDNGSLDRFLRNKRGELSVLQLIEALKGIASGMCHLSSMKYVHRDLAARNILVNSDLVCKVSDFGLSRTLENDPNATYTTQGGKIALRWTAPESMRYRQFTSASDVWSYGIVMWEVTSYGEKPYWEMSNEDVTEVIEDGYRLPAPLNCPPVLHNMMLLCWSYECRRRPTFSEIFSQLENLIRHPYLLQTESVVADSSAPLLNPDSPINLQDVSNLDEWLDMIKLGRYRRSFYTQGINDLNSLAQITASDLERLGIVSPSHKTRLQSGIDTLRRHLLDSHSNRNLSPGSSNTMRLVSETSPSPSSENRSFTLPSQQQLLAKDSTVVMV